MRLSPLVAFLFTALIARADEPPIIAKARAYLGSEEALTGVQSVHLVGSFVAGAAVPALASGNSVNSVTTGTPTAGAAPSSISSVDIIFQKPYQHHLVVTAIQTIPPTSVTTDAERAGIAPGSTHTSKVVRTIALNNYDAWERVEVNSNPSQLGLLGLEQIRVLRADVWENLGYYRGLEAEGGRIEDQGPVTQDGVACEKIAFIHSPTVIYYRYFDRDTGRLVYTETVGGLKIREEGTIEANGIKFPAKIITIEPTTAANPALRSTTLTIDHVTVNESFPASVFAVPLPDVPARAAINFSAPGAMPSSAPAPAAP